MSQMSLKMNISLFLCVCFLCGVYGNKVRVDISKGQIVGETITADNRQLTRFLGIPYAQAPVGRLRFRRPVPVDKWEKPIEALHWPSRCVQNTKHGFNSVSEGLLLNSTTSEDCLYLNIWSPKVNEVDETKLLPVIVWIHGGILIVGTSSFQLYDGDTLSARADAVVVTINYRLSTLGFLYSDEVDDVKGNQGLWDQVLALEWINQNIRYFGGNANQVTIMGESAGAKSISLHILSPVSRNLFRNAILMSGASMTDKVVNQPKQLVNKFLTGIRKIGCATEADLTISKNVLKCLETLDADKVDQILYLIDRDPLDIPPVVAVDGQFLPSKPIEMLAEGNFNSNINLLVSTVEDEGSSFLQRASPYFRKHNPEPVSLEEAQGFLMDLLSGHVLHQQVPEETISKLYFAGLNTKHYSEDLIRKRVGIAFGDLLISCPTLQFAKSLVRAKPNTTKVYQWFYKAKLGNEKLLCAKWAGTCHLDDVYPVFGVALRNPEMYHTRERDISTEVIGIIASFIRTGTPGKDHPEWISYFMTDQGKHLIAPYYEINNEHKTYESFKFNLKQMECDLIWNKYIYGTE